MKPSLIANCLETCFRAKQPVFMWGSPGVGKSDILRQVAKSLNMSVIDVRAILLDPVDLRGLPYVTDRKAHWAAPSFLPHNEDFRGILFLDELSAAPPMVQAACYQLVLDRGIGEYHLPEGCVVAAAGNRESDRAVVYAMPTPLRNRFTHLDFEVDQDDWQKWGLNSGIRPELLAFMKFRSDLLHQFAADNKKDNAFPSPRSWAFVSRILDQNPSPQIEFELIAGTVGKGAASEFSAFLRLHRDLPSFEEILARPDAIPVPKDPHLVYALTIGISRKIEDKTFAPAMTFLNRLKPEYRIMAVENAFMRTGAANSWMQKHPVFKKFSKDHADVMFVSKSE